MATRTAAERREEARREFDAYLATCPSRHVLARISDKWVTLVICRLGEAGQPLRFSELQRAIAGVSQKMLTQTLRNLAQDGLVLRTVYPTVPATVTYELTGLGDSLVEAIGPLKAWAEEHFPAIERAREQAAG